MKKCILWVFIIQIIFFISSLHSFALEKPCHFEINRYIAMHNIGGFSLDEYLTNQLGFQEGITEIIEQFENQKIKDEKGDPADPTISNWLGYGGMKEDEPFQRCFRHFHNPLKDWDEAGLKGICDSSIIWAQRAWQVPGGRYSWQDVRSDFYSALVSCEKSSRDTYFAETFKGLGQLMHLVEDASVPLHTRDDGHVLYNYETYVENMQKNDSNTFNGWIANYSNYGYDQSLLELAANPLAPISIARIVDTDKYTGLNPNVTTTEPIGIAEYTNANFLSDGTIPGSFFDGDFPYPKLGYPPEGSCELQYFQITDPRSSLKIVSRPYWFKIADGATGYRLATFPYLASGIFGLEFILPASLDENVYKDYAELLIPRAVGYAAGLLDYFFRGKLQVYPLPVFQDNNLYAYALNIKNITQIGQIGETLSNGKFTIVVRYTPEGGNENGSDDIFVNSTEADSGTLQYGEAANFQFFLTDSVPIDCFKSAKCMLVFKGTLGNENNAVIGQSFKRGKLKFIEEWDGMWAENLPGDHHWFSTIQGSSQNCDNGTTQNTILDGILNKTNTRNINDSRGRINESFIYFTDLCPYPGLNEYCEYKVVDPENVNPAGMLITPNTYVIFKINDLSINEQPPAPEGYTTAYQYMQLEFNAIMNGQVMDNFLALEFSKPGQAVDHDNVIDFAYDIYLGVINIYNIYALFQSHGIDIPDPLYLQVMDLTQKLEELAEASTIEHTQHMEVDFISIVEGNDEDQPQQQ